jgi:regulator of protease activity HflC (stomatin/prohibitin superfamily)
MDQIIAFIRQFIDLFVWWVIIKPWEQGVLVRLGKRVFLLYPGVHLRIPIIDSVFVQNTRRRMAITGRQTILSADGKSVTLCVSVGYAIDNILLLYNTLHHAEDTIINITIAQLAKTVNENQSTVALSVIEKQVQDRVNLTQFGLCDV